MNNFDIVKNDILGAVIDIRYDDPEKKLILSEIILNLYKLLENEDSYREDIRYLQIRNRDKTYRLKNNEQ